jgi:hypothetical protein
VATEPTRVLYRERQRLSAADLEAEQAYLLGLDARHNLQQHSAGIVRGLFLGIDLAGVRAVHPGVAIDRLGRDVVIAADTPIAGVEGEHCFDVWLLYCRQPGPEPCGRGTFQRWNEHAMVIATLVGAGDDPVSPADEAVHLGRLNCTPPDLAYISAIAAGVVDPAERVSLQVGPATGRDRNGFVVTVTDPAGAAITRLAIDRQGTNTVHGTVNLLGYVATAELATAAGQALVAEATTPGPDGERVRVLLDEETSSLLVFAGGRRVLSAPLELKGSLKELQQSVDRFNLASDLVRLRVLGEVAKPPAQPDPVQPAVAGPKVLASTSQSQGQTQSQSRAAAARAIALRPAGGRLDLEGWPPATQAAQVPLRGCDVKAQRREDAGVEPNGVSFMPIAKQDPGPRFSSVYSATVDVDKRSVDELRLDLGLEQDGDQTTRLSIVGVPMPPAPNEPFTWLTVNGECQVALAERNPTTPDQLISVRVDGVVEQSPMKPDITDPDFRALLVAAWLSGLQSSVQATTVVTPTFANLPAFIETGSTWTYTVNVANTGTEAVTVETIVETRNIANQTLLDSLGRNETIAPGATRAIAIQHRANEMPEGDLTIEVRLHGKVGRFPWWNAKSTDQPIPVLASPDIDSSDLPASAPISTPFEYTFTVTNNSAQAITLTAVTVAEGGVAQQLLNADRQVAAGATTPDFGPVLHDDGITADTSVEIAISYRYAAGQTSQRLIEKTIAAADDLQFQIAVTTATTSALTYSLTIDNAGQAPVTLQSLRQRNHPLGSAATAAQAIAGVSGTVILPGGSRRFMNVTGIQPTAAGQMDVEFEATYDRSGRTWTPPFQAATPRVTVQ